MNTFSERWDQIGDALKAATEQIGVAVTSIDDGKYGEAPKIAPFVWVYLEPIKGKASEQGKIGSRHAQCTIMCGAKMGKNSRQGIVTSLEIAEKCEKILEEINGVIFGERFVSFDTILADKAITILEFTTRYQRG